MQEKGQSKSFAFIIITILFFLWGAITSINDVLVQIYKDIYELSEFESMLLFLAFFGAYGVGALAYFIYSQQKGDPINKLGYKRGILLGLVIAGLGCLSLYPLTTTGNFYAYLAAFFTIGLGITLLQISCNPYIAILGKEDGASARLNLSQGFNSLGTTIGPLFAGYLILSYIAQEAAIQDLYLFCGAVFILFAIILVFIPIPDYSSEEKVVLKGNAWDFPNLRFGMVAIFCYVGAEVMIGGKIMPYLSLPEIGNLSVSDAASYLGIYWGGAMIGRLGISVVSNPSFNFYKKLIYGFITIMITYLVIVLFITVKTNFLDRGLDFHVDLLLAGLYETFIELKLIMPFLLIQFILMLIFRDSSRYLLSAFASVIIVLLLAAFIFEGQVALWCILSIGLFNSIMWSNIFTLSIGGLKEYTSQASSLLIIMIIGGAILPLGMGVISDLTGSIKYGFLFPIISYLYILYFGLYGSRTKKNL